MAKKYYWIKLHKDFFKRHDIKIVESMENGKDYILFYMKLLLESVDHDGYLRFSDTIPYNDKMLATITDTNIDIVRSAIKVFTELKLLEIMDDETIYLIQTKTMLGVETEWAEKKRLYRDKQQVLEYKEDKTRTKKDNVRQEIELEIELDIEIDKDIKTIEHFDTFWSVYPKKIGKAKCQRWFDTHKVDDTLLDTMLQAIHTQKVTEQWTKDDGKFIPHPYTWLNQGRWDDEVEQSRWDKIDMEGF
jgi:predicted phage replisome organizer